MSNKVKTLILQAAKFGAVGIINSLIDLGVFSLLRLIPFFDVYYPAAKVISFSCGVINSFIMNSYLTFREKPTRKKALLFIVVNVITFGVSVGTLSLCVEVWGISKEIGNLISIGCSMTIGFLLNKLIVFKGKHNAAQ